MPDLLTLARRKICGFAVITGVEGASRPAAACRDVKNPSLLLHIGIHKTGTTAIQRALRKNRRRLRGSGLWAQPPVINDLRAMLALKHLDEALRVKISTRIAALRTPRKPAVILSDESFSGDPLSGYRNAPEIARRLGKCTAGADVKVVVYLRRQDEFIESLYMQKIHEGHSMSFAEFLDQISGVHFNWHALLESYAEVFGRENIIVKRYEKRLMPRRESLLQGFFKLAGVDSAGLDLDQGPAAPNAGYSPVAAGLARQCNPLLNPAERRELRRILQEHNSKQPCERYTLMDRQTRASLMAVHEAGNARVAREYLGVPSGQLFEEVAQDGVGASATPPSQQELITALVRLLLRTRSQRPSSKLGRALVRLGEAM